MNIPSSQTLFRLEQAIVDADHDAQMAKLNAKLAARKQREAAKQQEEIEKSTRRMMRDHERKQKQPDQVAVCGINSHPQPARAQSRLLLDPLPHLQQAAPLLRHLRRSPGPQRRVQAALTKPLLPCGSGTNPASNNVSCNSCSGTHGSTEPTPGSNWRSRHISNNGKRTI